MNSKIYMSISEFAKITGIKRANLIFYDNIGLLSPEYRGKNGYRYYSRQQLGTAYLIGALRRLDIGLEEIKSFAQTRTPEQMILFFELQEKRIQEKMKRLRRMNEMMQLYTEMAQEALICKNIEGISLIEKKREPIFLEMEQRQEGDEEALFSFYDFATKKGLELDYPLCIFSAKEDLNQETWEENYRYYFRVKGKQNAYKPAGTYLTAYGNCAYGQSLPVYERLFQYISDYNLRICGNAYEEYLTNEISVQNDANYCVRVEIMVEHK